MQIARHSKTLMLLFIALVQLTQLAVNALDCSGINLNHAWLILYENINIVPTTTYVRPGSTTTAAFTGGAYLYVYIRSSPSNGSKELTPVECFTNLEWYTVEQNGQVLTNAYGSNPITFLPNVAFPTSFEVADLGTSVPDGSYEF